MLASGPRILLVICRPCFVCTTVWLTKLPSIHIVIGTNAQKYVLRVAASALFMATMIATFCYIGTCKPSFSMMTLVFISMASTELRHSAMTLALIITTSTALQNPHSCLMLMHDEYKIGEDRIRIPKYSCRKT
mmetsp:Transcript_18631/g.33294  ORF Transcript_18631/g.33294 Transcript_18631/m.33294 type:complete len:133 (+) Transcript_18631:480-878(+)